MGGEGRPLHLRLSGGQPTPAPHACPHPCPEEAMGTSAWELDRDTRRTSQKGHWREWARGQPGPCGHQEGHQVPAIPAEGPGPDGGELGSPGTPPTVHVPGMWGQGWYALPQEAGQAGAQLDAALLCGGRESRGGGHKSPALGDSPGPRGVWQRGWGWRPCLRGSAPRTPQAGGPGEWGPLWETAGPSTRGCLVGEPHAECKRGRGEWR